MTLKEVGIVIGKKLLKRRSLSGTVLVDFEGTELKQGKMLVSACGHGKTIAKAKANYCLHLRGQRLVMDAMLSTRNETQLPPMITVK